MWPNKKLEFTMEFPSKVDYFPMTAQYSLLVSCFNTNMSLD